VPTRKTLWGQDKNVESAADRKGITACQKKWLTNAAYSKKERKNVLQIEFLCNKEKEEGGIIARRLMSPLGGKGDHSLSKEDSRL